MVIKYPNRTFITAGLVCVVLAFLLLEWGSYYLQRRMLLAHEIILTQLVKEDIAMSESALKTHREMAKMTVTQNNATIEKLNNELLTNRRMIHDNIVVIMRLREELRALKANGTQKERPVN